MARERFHIALVPYRDTPFNRARSVNKIHDVAAFGAAGLYSDRQPLSDVVRDGEHGMVLGDDLGAWAAAIAQCMADRDGTRRLAEANAALSREIGDPGRVRQFWLERLMPDAG